MGDILNIIGLETKEISYIFRKFEPVTRMIISRDSGLLNDYFSIVKGQLIDLYYFATIGPMENDQPEEYDYEDKVETIDDFSKYMNPPIMDTDKPKKRTKKKAIAT